jgi:hypothetical protein
VQIAPETKQPFAIRTGECINEMGLAAAEYLTPKLIQHYFPHRVEELRPAVCLDHYVQERPLEGRLGSTATWNWFPPTPGSPDGSVSPDKSLFRLGNHTKSPCSPTRSQHSRK